MQSSLTKATRLPPCSRVHISRHALAPARRGNSQQRCQKQPLQVACASRERTSVKDPKPLEQAASGVDGYVDGGATTRGGLWQRLYPFFTGFPFPLGPVLARQTVRVEVVPDTIWTFEQEQSLAGINVATTVRMTVVKLRSGGLFVYAPIAPTRECMQLLAELRAPVEHIVLTSHAYEHKVFVAPFQRRFPKAQVWTSPRQWSFPVDLPLPLLGIFGARVLDGSGPAPAWAGELEYASLAEPIGIAPYSETVFFHRPSRTLMVTDAVVYVAQDPPQVINRARLLRAGSDNLLVKTVYFREQPQHPRSEQEQVRLGWARMALLIFYFMPKSLREAHSFPAIRDKLVVMPVTQFLVFNKIPGPVRRWVDKITQWDFQRVVSAHFCSPVDATPADFKAAFTFAYDMEHLGQSPQQQRREAAAEGVSFPSVFGDWPEGVKRSTVRWPEEDIQALGWIDKLLRVTGSVFKIPNND